MSWESNRELSLSGIWRKTKKKDKQRQKKKFYQICRDKYVSAKKHKTIQQKYLTHPDKIFCKALQFPTMFYYNWSCQ